MPGGRKKGIPGENPSRQCENQQQTQPATLVGGERSHHCAIFFPQDKALYITYKWLIIISLLQSSPIITPEKNGRKLSNVC